MKLSVRNLATLALAAFLGCGDHPSSHLAQYSSDAGFDDDDGFARLRQRAALRVLDSAGNLVPEWDDAVLATTLRDGCVYVAGSDDFDRTGISGNYPCAWSIYEKVESYICVANALMEIAQNVGEPFEIPPAQASPAERYSVPVQSLAARSRVAELAVEQAMIAASNAGVELDAFAAGVSSLSCADSAASAIDSWRAPYSQVQPLESNARALAMFFVEASELAREATLRAVDLNVDLADAYFAEELSPAEAARYAYTSPEQSRANAAHLIAGGIDGLYNLVRDTDSTVDASAALCGAPELSRGARDALSVLRAAGVAPTDLENPEISTSSILESNDLPSGHPSVRSLLPQSYARGGISAQALLSGLGLRLSDFDEARAYLREERLAFARPASARLPPQQLANGTFVRRYAATATPPSRAPRGFYSTLARYAPFAPSDSYYGAPQSSSVDRGLIHFLSYAHGVADSVVAKIALGTPIPSDLEAELAGPLMALAARRDELVGRLNTSYYRTTGLFRARVAYDNPRYVGRLAIVFGEDGMRCATSGDVDGAPCSLSDYTILSVASHYDRTGSYSWRAANRVAYDLEDYFSATIVLEEPRLYLLAASDNASVGEAGGYTVLAGEWIYGGSSGYYTSRGIAPSLDRRVEELLAPSPDWCTHPRTSCAGLSFDERIPLENELSDDGDSVETSWRTYLALARQAADEADELGAMVIESGLALDRRSEVSESELVQICGSSVNADIFSGGLTVAPFDSCSSDSDCGGASCVSGHCDRASCAHDEECLDGAACIAGMCLRTADSEIANAGHDDTNLQRLSECIGSGATVDTVTLGTVRQCYWRVGNDICGDISELGEPGWIPPACPQPEVADGCAGLPSLPGDLAWIPTSSELGYFQTDITNLDTSPGTNCNTLRSVRDGATVSERRAALDAMLQRYPSVAPARRIAGALGVRPNPGGTATVLLDGDEWFSTGGLYRTTPPSSWPCGAPLDHAICTESDQSLFCTSDVSDCTSGATVFAERLGRAVAAARVITDVGFRGTFRGFEWQFNAPVADVRYVDRQRTESETVAWTIVSGETQEGRPAYCYEGVLPSWFGGQIVLCDPYNTYFVGGDAVAEVANERLSGVRNARRWLRGLSGSPAVTRTGASGIVSLRSYSLEVLEDFVAEGNAAASRAARDARFSDNQTDLNMRNGLAQVYAKAGWRQNGAIFDALELICEASTEHPSRCSNEPPSVMSVADLDAVRAHLECKAAEIETLASRIILSELPSRAVDALREQNSTGAFPVSGGTYAQGITRLRATLVRMNEIPRRVASQLRQLSGAIRELELSLHRLELTGQQDAIALASTIANQVTACATATAQATSPKAVESNQGAVAAIACTNSAVQIGLAIGDFIIGQQIDDVDEQLAISSLTGRFELLSTTIDSLGAEMLTLFEALDAELAGLDTLQTAARRALSRAAYLNTSDAGAHYAVGSVMRRRYDANLFRYEQARSNAVEMAFLARRAVEQRLGLRLDQMREDLTLVEAPAAWADRLCSMSGIRYSQERASEVMSEERGEDFDSLYIGDYVERLEELVQSYRIDYPFQQGGDTSVVSLRDDVVRARAECPTLVPNHVYFAENLSSSARLENGEAAWMARGCEVGIDGRELPNCASAVPLDSGVDEELGHHSGPIHVGSNLLEGPRSLGVPVGYRVYLGDAESTSSCVDCGLGVDTEYTQRLSLDAGAYRLSWYAADVVGSEGLAVGGVDVVSDATGASLARGRRTVLGGDRWTRSWTLFHLDEPQVVRVGVFPVGTEPMVSQAVDVAGVMVTRVDWGTELSSASVVGEDEIGAPGPFMATGADRTRPLATCVDVTGDVFREGWQYSCFAVCDDGIGRCSESPSTPYCFWETRFRVSQADIEAGRQFGSAGFARGNYNYRVDTIGLNFVGSRVRDCSESASPSTCYSSGYVPYSIEHIGPYTVRNHLGEDYDAPLFTGRIEHARGLAAERYLTNPLSSTDRALIEPYMRRELRGRPLDGTYVIRVWDEEGFNFHGIEDVQVVLNYAYWTRTD